MKNLQSSQGCQKAVCFEPLIIIMEDRNMRLITWNVNGIRAVMKKGLEQMLDYLDADIVCFQETKAQPDQIELSEDLYPYQYANSAVRKGYSGTLIASRIEPLSVVFGIGVEEHDTEGRVITAEFPEFYLVDVYVPNAGEGLRRLDYRVSWDQAFGAYVASLNEKKPVLLCGDFNVARTPQDIWDQGEGEEGTAGYTPQEREGFEKNLLSFLSDSFRVLHPQSDQYTWWSYYSRGRERNQGWRIDYWLVSPRFMNHVRDVRILDDVYGSDHCPVELEISLPGDQI